MISYKIIDHLMMITSKSRNKLLEVNLYPLTSFEPDLLELYLRDNNRLSFTFCFISVLNSFAICNVKYIARTWHHEYNLMRHNLYNIFIKKF